MPDLSARVAYLQGLAEGLHVEDSGPEGLVLAGVINVLGDIADAVEAALQATGDLAEQVDAVDDEVGALLGECEEEEAPDGEVIFIPDDGTVENSVSH